MSPLIFLQHFLMIVWWEWARKRACHKASSSFVFPIAKVEDRQMDDLNSKTSLLFGCTLAELLLVFPSNCHSLHLVQDCYNRLQKKYQRGFYAFHHVVSKIYCSIIDSYRITLYLRSTVILFRFLGICEQSFKKYLKMQKVICSYCYKKT